MTHAEHTNAVVYLVAVDASEASDHVVEVACGLAGGLAGAAELHLVHVVGLSLADVPVAGPGLVSLADLREGGRAVLDRATSIAQSKFAGCVKGHLAAGEPWREITAVAASLYADLVIVGTAGRTGLARLALGSVAEHVVRHAGCPVLVVRPKQYQPHVAPAADAIAPPCPDCVAVQTTTAGASLWCERHAAHHPHGRLHYETPAPFAMGSMLVRP